ncbi:MAG: FAD binding domain-containing protein [Lachnospiraceae bacterium]|nr:FAD binding domain-containing protein [Lachnospiraceae bacterium]
MEAYVPKSYSEVKECLSKMTPDSKFLGGGTDFIIRLHSGMAKPGALCYLGAVDEFRRIETNRSGIVIGGYATMTEMEHNEVIREQFPALMDAASDVGSLQIRNHGTIGGNLGNASPAGDLIPVLYLYDAVIEALGPDGTRMIPITELIERPGKTVLDYNEAIYRIHMPFPKFKSSFVKLGTRKKVTIARIDMALGISMEQDKVKSVRILIGAISVRPVKLREAEEFLIGKPLNEYNIMKVAEILSDYIMANTPKEFDRDYKVYASRGVVMDTFLKLDREKQ